MAEKLITFLGKGQRHDGGYRPATYVFGQDRIHRTPYFGLALLEDLARHGPLYEFIVCGTASSIWDALLDRELAADETWLTLSEAVDEGRVDDALLDVVTPLVAENFARRGLAEQTALLDIIASLVDEGDTLHMDITHGFRILPMLGLISALLLKSIKNVTMAGLYYGALEMTDSGSGQTPVVELGGLIHIADWLFAISAFRASGDYGLFSPLLPDADMADNFNQAGFYEKTLNIAHAGKLLKQGRQQCVDLRQTDPVLSLFGEQLNRFTSWCEEPNYARRQMAAARAALRVGGYVRCADLAVEAMITSRVAKGENARDYHVRQKARDAITAQLAGTARSGESFSAAYRELNDLRNAVSHGTLQRHDSHGQQSTLQNRQKMEQRLAQLLNQLGESLP